MRKIFFTAPFLQNEGIAFIRIVTGIFLIYHGWEVFDAKKIVEYAAWDVFKTNFSPSYLVYLGKGTELITGLLLLIGLFTRITSLIIISTFIYISFFVGNGKIWYEDQHPFLFVLLALVFFFTGAGKWSMDGLLFQEE